MSTNDTPTQTPTRRTRRRIGYLAALTMTLLVTGLAGVMTATPASALCTTSPLQGHWNNVDPATHSIVQADIRFNCSDVILCPVGGPCTGGQSTHDVRLWGACSPTLCDWGWRRATAQSDGWWLAVWTQSYATRNIWVRTEEWYGLTYLRVSVFTDFTAADGRTDYWSTDWMLKP